jgi:hypothetical protein
MAIPVSGPPQEFLHSINVGDIPNSGYQEESNLTADIVRTTGIDDSQSGVSQLSGAQTATGAQLVQASANVRIQQKVLLLETDVVKPTGRQWLAMNQQRIRTVRVEPGPPRPMEAEKRWAWYAVGPEQLAGEWGIDVVGGSSQPDNVPQKRQDGEQVFQMFAGNQMIDQAKLFAYVLKEFDVRNSQGWVLPPPPPPPPGQEAPPGAPGTPSQGQEGTQGPQGQGEPQNGAPGTGLVLPANAMPLIEAGIHDAAPHMTPHDIQMLIQGAIMHAREIDSGQLPAPAANGASAPPPTLQR